MRSFRSIAVSLSVCGVLILSACATEVGSEAESMPDAHRLAVLYGTDQRVEALQHPSASLRAAARNGVMLVSRGSVTKGADGYLEFDALTLAEAQNLCPGEVFASQITPGTCSGFLIGGDRVISAGHCFGTWEQTIAQSNELCPFIDVVLDYELAANGSGPRVPNDRLFGCKRVLSRDLQENDAVQFELDRDTGRAGLTLDPVTPLVTGGALTAVGHPDGIAKKIVTCMRVRNPNEIAGVGGGGLFMFEGDLFHGNSAVQSSMPRVCVWWEFIRSVGSPTTIRIPSWAARAPIAWRTPRGHPQGACT